MSMNPSGRDGKRLSEASLTESCTSDCENYGLCDADVVAGLDASTPVAAGIVKEEVKHHNSCEEPATIPTATASSVTAIIITAADTDVVPEKYRANYAKKLEAESKKKSSSKLNDSEANGLLNSSGDDESTTPEETSAVATAVNHTAESAAVIGGGGESANE